VTRVRVTAPSPVVRAGLEALLGPSFEVVDDEPDVLLVDVDDWDEESVAEWVSGGAPVVALVPDLSDAGTLVRAGVRGVLPQEADARELAAAVEAAASGLVVVHPNGVAGLVTPARARVDSTPLTPREVEVLRLLADGEGNKQIAWKLGITEHTVKFHVASILNKLNAGSRTEAVAIGIRQGLVMV
jgi:DNA-binding NarL/FixJ family response regulator